MISWKKKETNEKDILLYLMYLDGKHIACIFKEYSYLTNSKTWYVGYRNYCDCLYTGTITDAKKLAIQFVKEKI